MLRKTKKTIIRLISYKQAMPYKKIISWLLILCFTINSTCYGFDKSDLSQLRQARMSMVEQVESSLAEVDDPEDPSSDPDSIANAKKAQRVFIITLFLAIIIDIAF